MTLPREGLPLAGRTKLSFGTGAVAFGVKDTAFGYFLLIYYQQVLGLDASLAGLALAIAIVFDAVTDLGVGYLSDNCKSRWGRRHPFMYLAILPTAVAFYYLWNPVLELSQMGLFVYLTVMAVLVRTCLTLFEIPSSALGAELSYDYDTRTSLMSLRYALGWWGGLILVFCAYAFFLRPTEEDPAGTLNADGYEMYGLVGALVMMVAMLVSALGTHSRIPHLPKATRGDNEDVDTLLRQIIGSFRNRSFFSVFGARLLGGVAAGMTSNLSIYFTTFFWELTSDQIKYFVMLNLGAVTLASLTVTRLSITHGKKNTALWVALFAIVFAPVPLVLRLMGLFPENESPFLLPILFAHDFIEVFAAVTASILIASMLADIVEDAEVKTGRRNEGLFFAANGFAAKLVSGAGILFAGIVLSLIDFPTQAIPGSVPAETLTHLALAFLPIVLLLRLMSWGALWFYDIDRATHARNLEVVSLDHDATGTNVPPMGN